MRVLLILPIIIPLVTAAVSLVAWRSWPIKRALGLIGAAGLLVSALLLLRTVWIEGPLAVQLGGWPAPFGITFVADLLSAIMVSMAGIIGMAVAVYSLPGIDTLREKFGYYPLLHILLMGVCGAFLTGDMFNLFVWFEILLTASFVLMALGGEQIQLEGAIKYVTINLIASAIFLIAVGFLYGIAGTLNMADLAVKLRQTEQEGFKTVLAMLFLVVFGIKAALFPLYFWLPSSYHTPPPAVSAIFAGLLTKVGVYALLRIFTLLFIHDRSYTHTLILIMAALTMMTGALGALAQHEFRRILSFQIIAQIGFPIMGLGLFSPLALAGSVFFLIEDVIVLTNIFLVSGVAHRLHRMQDLKRIGGLYQAHPAVALLFLIPALSLSGIPPLSGFFAKLALVRAGLESARYLLVATALLTSLLVLYSNGRIWSEVFWKPEPSEIPERPEPEDLVEERSGMRTLLLPIAALAALTVIIGLAAEPVFVLAEQAAGQLLDPGQYVAVVLENRQ